MYIYIYINFLLCLSLYLFWATELNLVVMVWVVHSYVLLFARMATPSCRAGRARREALRAMGGADADDIAELGERRRVFALLEEARRERQ